MKFECAHCGQTIHSVSAVVDGNVIHHRCKKAYEEKKKTISDFLEGTTGLITEPKIIENYTCCK
jgi:hypothetical protein